MGEKPKSLKFKYVYPEDLRDLYVNGVFGGVTPRNEIHAHFFSERHPIPKSVTHELKENGSLGPEKSIEKGGDVVRFVQTSIIMDVGAATVLRDWLTQNIEFVKKMKMEETNGTKK